MTGIGLIAFSLLMNLSEPQDSTKSKPATTPTYKADIAPMLVKNCQPCHYPGGKVFGKLPFEQYLTVKKLGLRLNTRFKEKEQLDMVKQWVKAGKSERMKEVFARCIGLMVSLLMFGCNSYITRIVSDSIANIAAPIPPAPHQTLSPVLPSARLAVTWVGHASVIFQIHDKVFLTDPVFTKTVGMLAHRKVGLGIIPDSLSRVDVTLISHTHFDHLSYGSLAKLPKKGALLVARGAAEYVPEFGFTETLAIGAWEVWERDGVRVTAVPVQHFGGRYGIDSNWYDAEPYTGWVVEYQDKRVFIGGDTGYNPAMFKEVGRRFAGDHRIDLAILPIAPSRSEGLGGGVHVSPLGAVEIFKEVGAQWMVPMHYKTFFQGSDASPAWSQETLQRIANEQGLQGRIKILEIGEQWIAE